ncbi:MAG: DUF5071 domain-containing protein [Rhodobacteraceae bacterium]|nr:DUF5071 domain-containing protein [Paracoccaceae bacterium]
MNLKGCIPTDKHDAAAVARAREIGVPALGPILPELLEWTQDCNWPVAREVSDLLSGAGPEIIPHLRQILASNDGCWKFSVLCDLVPFLDRDVLSALQTDLRRLAKDPTDDDRREEVDLLAKETLAKF